MGFVGATISILPSEAIVPDELVGDTPGKLRRSLPVAIKYVFAHEIPFWAPDSTITFPPFLRNEVMVGFHVSEMLCAKLGVKGAAFGLYSSAWS